MAIAARRHTMVRKQPKVKPPPLTMMTRSRSRVIKPSPSSSITGSSEGHHQSYTALLEAAIEDTRRKLDETTSERDELKAREAIATTCIICRSPNYYPRMLGCGHVFCQGCLTSQFEATKGGPTCSICRTPISLKFEPIQCYDLKAQVEAWALANGVVVPPPPPFKWPPSGSVEDDDSDTDFPLGGERGSLRRRPNCSLLARDGFNEDMYDICIRLSVVYRFSATLMSHKLIAFVVRNVGLGIDNAYTEKLRSAGSPWAAADTWGTILRQHIFLTRLAALPLLPSLSGSQEDPPGKRLLRDSGIWECGFGSERNPPVFRFKLPSMDTVARQARTRISRGVSEGWWALLYITVLFKIANAYGSFRPCHYGDSSQYKLRQLEGYYKTVHPGYNANAGPRHQKYTIASTRPTSMIFGVCQSANLEIWIPAYAPATGSNGYTSRLYRPGFACVVGSSDTVLPPDRQRAVRALDYVSSLTLKQAATYSQSFSDALDALSSDVHFMKRMCVLSLVMGKSLASHPHLRRIFPFMSTEAVPDDDEVVFLRWVPSSQDDDVIFMGFGRAFWVKLYCCNISLDIQKPLIDCIIERCLARRCPHKLTGNLFVALPMGVNQNGPTQANSMELLREFFSCMCGALLFKPYFIHDKCPTPGCHRPIDATPALCYGFGDKVESFAKEFGIDIPDTEPCARAMVTCLKLQDCHVLNAAGGHKVGQSIGEVKAGCVRRFGEGWRDDKVADDCGTGNRLAALPLLPSLSGSQEDPPGKRLLRDSEEAGLAASAPSVAGWPSSMAAVARQTASRISGYGEHIYLLFDDLWAQGMRLPQRAQSAGAQPQVAVDGHRCATSADADIERGGEGWWASRVPGGGGLLPLTLRRRSAECTPQRPAVLAVLSSSSARIDSIPFAARHRVRATSHPAGSRATAQYGSSFRPLVSIE
ncbi:uncharacterized protein SCHCODRAFT_02602803 [Schizophyllum commune H4-8]|uniref:uncharacterized protein n=1 Tax=Schizophyllum commune (strain H4-8 / FGSC 9210) TaxID=578458 RepID=UPI0021602EEF|nr:uncharacterized protein SCHCODRAFT_02602803 [Schizophyllum commune H4-8]KAI5887179.1 hypothetical protein SCHCODRAFT_02602803 [Schizophyllum commune H4-8]